MLEKRLDVIINENNINVFSGDKSFSYEREHNNIGTPINLFETFTLMQILEKEGYSLDNYSLYLTDWKGNNDTQSTFTESP